MKALSRFLAQYWVGEAILLAVFGSIVLIALLMQPTVAQVSLFGWEVPTLCGFRLLTGAGCPGCGLTRSFSFMAHLQPVQAFQMNPMGPPLFLAFASQVPYRTYTLLRELSGRAVPPMEEV